MTEDYMRRDVNFNTIHATNEKHFDIFFEILEIKEGDHLLDVGGGYGELASEFFKRDKDINYHYNLLEPSKFQINKGKYFIQKATSDYFYKNRVSFIHNDFLKFNTDEKYENMTRQLQKLGRDYVEWNPFFFSASFSTFSASYMEISARLYQNLR
jgi:ubiquinone/menaquinone biosynthesis C-methylase UbiE